VSPCREPISIPGPCPAAGSASQSQSFAKNHKTREAPPSYLQGAAETKIEKKTMYLHTLFGLDFFLDARFRVFGLPLSRNAQKRNKKIDKKKN
jgi:hypothetical protein